MFQILKKIPFHPERDFLFVFVLLCLVLAGSGGLLAQSEVAPPVGHAHNDYASKKPLVTALEMRMKSIEVDVHLAGGMLYVAHHRPFRRQPHRRLEEMYLRPLFEYVDTHGGSVYKDEPLLLMIDIKGDAAASYAVLKQCLKPYRHFLSRIEEGRYVEGAVKVFLSGNRPLEEVLNDAEAYVFLDGRPGDLGKDIPATRMPVVSFKAASELPTPLRRRNREALSVALQNWAERCAGEGKLLRLWAAPDKPWFWQLLLDAGIPLVNTDRPAELRTFVTSRPHSAY